MVGYKGKLEGKILFEINIRFKNILFVIVE